MTLDIEVTAKYPGTWKNPTHCRIDWQEQTISYYHGDELLYTRPLTARP